MPWTCALTLLGVFGRLQVQLILIMQRQWKLKPWNKNGVLHRQCGNRREIIRKVWVLPKCDYFTSMEIKLCVFLAEHNLSISLSNNFVELPVVLFPQDNVLTIVKVRDQKATNIISKALGCDYLHSMTIWQSVKIFLYLMYTSLAWNLFTVSLTTVRKEIQTFRMSIFSCSLSLNKLLLFPWWEVKVLQQVTVVCLSMSIGKVGWTGITCPMSYLSETGGTLEVLSLKVLLLENNLGIHQTIHTWVKVQI